jgi:hypothetical protein
MGGRGIRFKTDLLNGPGSLPPDLRVASWEAICLRPSTLRFDCAALRFCRSRGIRMTPLFDPLVRMATFLRT